MLVFYRSTQRFDEASGSGFLSSLAFLFRFHTSLAYSCAPAMGKGFHHVCDREATLIRNMRQEGCTWPFIQRVTGRGQGTLAKVVVVAVAAFQRRWQRQRKV